MAGLEHTGAHLRKQRREERDVVAADEPDLHVSPPAEDSLERPCCPHAGEATAKEATAKEATAKEGTAKDEDAVGQGGSAHRADVHMGPHQVSDCRFIGQR